MVDRITYTQIEQQIQELRQAYPECKPAEEALKQSREQLESILSNMQSINYRCMLDKDLTMLYMSSNVEQLTGYPSSDFINNAIRSYRSIIHRDDTDNVAQRINTAIGSGKPWELEYRICHRDGSIRWMFEIGTAVSGPDGNLQHLNGSIINITERIQIIESLRKSEEKYRNIVEKSDDLIWKTDLDLRATYINSAIVRKLGFTKTEWLAKDIKAQMTASSYEHLIELFSLELQKEHEEDTDPNRIVRAEAEYYHKNGTTLWLELLISALRDDTGVISGLQGISRDITERKQAEEALLESEAKYRSMMEAMEDAIYICSSDYRIEYMNPAMLKRIGRDATGETCHKVIHGLNEICPWCVHENVMRRQSINVEVMSPLDDRSYLESNSPIFHTDGSISKLTIYKDISDIKNMEKQLHHVQKMESIGQLAGGIAHDFNNILSSIIGFTELTLDDVEKDSMMEDNLQEIYTAGKRAKELVRQILTFARQSEEEVKPLQVNGIIEEVLNLIRSSIPTTIKIDKNIDSNSLIIGNQTQVYQILMNLCTNAAHAMEDQGGVLKVSRKDVEVDRNTTKEFDLKPGNYTELNVSGTGIGIPTDIINSIFEPYFTTKDPGEGTGMGLAVIHGIVESYGGKICVDTRVGKGTTFSIYLPVTRKRKIQHQYESEQLPTGTERILFVDDEAPIAKLGSQGLERLGYQVTTRTSSVEALELFRSKPNEFDLIITDMTMPNITGDKLAIELMKIRPDIPVIICTGYSKKISDESAAEIGIKAFVYKPIVKTDLARIIRKVFDEANG